MLLSDDLFPPVEADAGRREGGVVMHRELPARPDVEHYRKEAKELVRRYAAREGDAVARAHAVIGARADERFLLADAQYVVAVEHGHPSWPAFKRAFEPAGLGALLGVERAEIVLDSGLRYTEGKPVEVVVKKRTHRYAVGDGGNAVALAGKPHGWLPVAADLVEEFSVNVNRRGVVLVGTVYPEMLARLVAQVAAASLAVYQALLELDD
jgi:hypothetical protein